MFVSVIMSEEWGAADDAPVVVAPEVQDIKLFGKWSTDDVQVSDISLTVSGSSMCVHVQQLFTSTSHLTCILKLCMSLSLLLKVLLILRSLIQEVMFQEHSGGYKMEQSFKVTNCWQKAIIYVSETCEMNIKYNLATSPCC